MNTNTQNYIDEIKNNIEEIKNKQQLPKWQIDFDKYGGRVAYETFKHFYWDRFDKGYKNNNDLLPDIQKLMEQFRKDLHVKLIPKKYEIYR